MDGAAAGHLVIDAELVSQAATGDARAFTRIVAAHHVDMLRVCLTVCGDAGTAEDAVQAAWALAWRRLPSLRDGERLRPWLVSIAANQARDAIRRRGRHPVVELELEASDDGAGDPGRRSGDIDLRNALARLDPTDRAIVALRYVAGFDSGELGRALGMSAAGTRARLARILDRLRKDLGDA